MGSCGGHSGCPLYYWLSVEFLHACAAGAICGTIIIWSKIHRDFCFRVTFSLKQFATGALINLSNSILAKLVRNMKGPLFFLLLLYMGTLFCLSCATIHLLFFISVFHIICHCMFKCLLQGVHLARKFGILKLDDTFHPNNPLPFANCLSTILTFRVVPQNNT